MVPEHALHTRVAMNRCAEFSECPGASVDFLEQINRCRCFYQRQCSIRFKFTGACDFVKSGYSVFQALE